MAVPKYGPANVQDHRPMLFDQDGKGLLVVSEHKLLQQLAVAVWSSRTDQFAEMFQDQTELCGCHETYSPQQVPYLIMPVEAPKNRNLGEFDKKGLDHDRGARSRVSLWRSLFSLTSATLRAAERFLEQPFQGCFFLVPKLDGD